MTRADAYIPDIEILSVRAGLRDVALAEIPRGLFPAAARYLSGGGIAYKAVTQDQMHLKRLALGLRPSGDRRPDSLLLYAGKDEAAVEKLYELDIRDESVPMGLLLGYPPCCVDYYQAMKADPAGHPDWKGFFKYVPHHPCSRGCAPSVEMENKLRELCEAAASQQGIGCAK